MTYFETVRDVYLRAARELYRAAAEADPETADPEQYLARADELRDKGLETWPLSVRQERTLYSLRAKAEANTREGRAHTERVRASILRKLEEQQ